MSLILTFTLTTHNVVFCRRYWVIFQQLFGNTSSASPQRCRYTGAVCYEIEVCVLARNQFEWNTGSTRSCGLYFMVTQLGKGDVASAAADAVIITPLKSIGSGVRKNSWTQWDAIWGMTHMDPRKHWGQGRTNPFTAARYDKIPMLPFQGFKTPFFKKAQPSSFVGYYVLLGFCRIILCERRLRNVIHIK